MIDGVDVTCVDNGMPLPDAVGHELTSAWPAGSSQVDVEHPTGHLLFDGIAFPRA